MCKGVGYVLFRCISHQNAVYSMDRITFNICSIQRHKYNSLFLALFRSWQTTNPEGTVSPHDLNLATTTLAFRTIRQGIGYNDAFNQQGESYTMDHDVYDFLPGHRKHSCIRARILSYLFNFSIVERQKTLTYGFVFSPVHRMML